MATEQPSPQPDDVGDRVIDDVRKAARHLEELLPEVKRYISSDVLRALQHGLSQLRLLGPAGRRGAADDQPMRHLTAAEIGYELHLGDQMVNRLRLAGHLYGYLPDGRRRGRVYPAFQAWGGIFGEPLRQVLLAIGDTEDERLNDFFDGEILALGGITPVEALLGRSFQHRGEPSPQAREILSQSAAQRLARVVDEAKAWRR